MVPAELNALLKRRKEKREDDYFRNGILCSIVVNLTRKKGARFSKPQDFIPKPDHGSVIPLWKRQHAYIEMLNKMLGGKDLRTAVRAARSKTQE